MIIAFELITNQLSIIIYQGSGDVAQLGERRLCKPEVAGPSPVVSIVWSAWVDE